MQKKLKMLSIVTISAILISVDIQSTYAFENQSSNNYINKADIKDKNLITYMESIEESNSSYQLNINNNCNSLEIYGINKPTSTHNLKTQGKMSFSGSAQNTTLYSNNKFTGSTSAEYRIENYSTDKLIVRVRKSNLANTIVKTLTVPANTAMGGFLSLDSSTKYYLQFDRYSSGPTNFSGYLFHSK